MYPKNIRLSKLKSWNQKQFLLSTAITIGIVNPANVISKPLINPKLNEINNTMDSNEENMYLSIPANVRNDLYLY